MADSGSDILIYSSLFDSNADGVAIVSPDLHIIYWNPRLAELLHVNSTNAVGNEIQNILPEQVKSLFMNNLTSSLEGNTCSDEFHLQAKNQQKTLYSISFSPFSLPGSDETHSLVQFRILPEKVLQPTIQGMMTDSPLPMALYAKNGTPFYYNESFLKIWDVPFSQAERIFEVYNIFQDEQLNKEPYKTLIEEAFDGKMVELPVLVYNPARTESLKEIQTDRDRYLKAYLFPLASYREEDAAVFLIIHDMTEQKRSEVSLLENEQKLQAMTLGLPGVIYEYHIPFGEEEPYFNYVSERITGIMGVSREEVQQDAAKLFDLVHPFDRENMFESLNRKEQVDKYWVWSGRFIINDEIKWIEAKSSPGIIREDRIIRYGLMMDITDKKNIEDAHLRTEERLRIALEAADLGFWEWDVLEKRKIFNSSWAYRFGYSDEEAENFYKDWEALVHPEDLPGVKKKLNRYLKKPDDLYEAEYRFRMADGSYRWIHDRGSGTATNHKGRIIRATGTYVDIQEKKENERRSRRQEQLFSHLFENSPVGIVFLDEEMIVRQVNPGFSEMFGFEVEDLVGQKLDNRIVPEDLMEESLAINRSTRSGRAQKLETYRVNAENEPVPVIIYSIPVIYQGQTIGIYGLYVDITDRVKVEKELEVRNLELDNFVYKVSHDLRAPLSSIMGLVNLVNHERGSDSVYEYIGMIENRIKQLDHFISDILSHSKNLKMDVIYSQINFRSIIDDCFSSLSYLPQTSQISKKINIEGGDFYSDQWRISEILRNLISNAVKYYSTRRDESYIEIDIMVERTYASIYFGDNGIGITEDRLPKVFEMFYRATEMGEGSGIGLYIVKNAIERLGGVIRVKSEANKGTSFEITLPNAIRELENQEKKT